MTLPSDLTHRPSRAEGGSPAGRVRRTFLYHRLSPHHIATPAQHHMSQHTIIRVIVSRLVERLAREGLREKVRAVAIRRDVLDAHDAHGLELAHLEEAAIDVPRAVARLAVARELDGTLVVDAQRGGLVLHHHVGAPACQPTATAGRT